MGLDFHVIHSFLLADFIDYINICLWPFGLGSSLELVPDLIKEEAREIHSMQDCSPGGSVRLCNPGAASPPSLWLSHTSCGLHALRITVSPLVLSMLKALHPQSPCSPIPSKKLAWCNQGAGKNFKQNKTQPKKLARGSSLWRQICSCREPGGHSGQWRILILGRRITSKWSASTVPKCHAKDHSGF